MREVILSSLSAFVKAENFPGKRQYIVHQRGLEQLGEWISLKGPEQEKKIGKAAQARKINVKLRQLLFDLLSNDDSILDDGFLVRDKLGANFQLVDALIDTIRQAKITVTQESQLREYTLSCLLRLYQRNPNGPFKYDLLEVLKAHKAKLTDGLTANPERAEAIQTELDQTEQVLNAPDLQNVVNFPKIKPEQSKDEVRDDDDQEENKDDEDPLIKPQPNPEQDLVDPTADAYSYAPLIVCVGMLLLGGVIFVTGKPF